MRRRRPWRWPPGRRSCWRPPQLRVPPSLSPQPPSWQPAHQNIQTSAKLSHHLAMPYQQIIARAHLVPLLVCRARRIQSSQCKCRCALKLMHSRFCYNNRLRSSPTKYAGVGRSCQHIHSCIWGRWQPLPAACLQTHLATGGLGVQ